ncbi:hypothetical protein SAMN05192534_10583 [Alteribacillus persepolensis]|uniref:Uncharacterized protein n=1 Tax=Alteribacillus persepolensis TaxID=568899 RepID=A0A1G8C6S8_9BACI|nr:hypothetical protein SAMN05192534_10583 [Alteribacillus persepolensis]
MLCQHTSHSASTAYANDLPTAAFHWLTEALPAASECIFVRSTHLRRKTPTISEGPFHLLGFVPAFFMFVPLGEVHIVYLLFGALPMSHKKKGAPMTAATSPEGISLGASIILPAVSAKTSKAAPSNSATGNTFR